MAYREGHSNAKHINIAATRDEPYVYDCFLDFKMGRDENCMYPSIGADIMINALTMLNISWTVHSPRTHPDMYLVSLDENGTYGGLIGDIIRGGYDTNPEMWYITDARMDGGFYYGFPLLLPPNEVTGFVFHEPSAESSLKPFRFLIDVLEPNMWRVCFVASVLLALIMVVSKTIHLYEKKVKKTLANMAEALFQMLRSMLDQLEHDSDGATSSYNAIFLTAAILAMVFEIVYSASLLGTILNQAVHPPFNTIAELAELIEHGGYRLIRTKDEEQYLFYEMVRTSESVGYRMLNRSVAKHSPIVIDDPHPYAIIYERLQKDPKLVYATYSGVPRGKCSLSFMYDSLGAVEQRSYPLNRNSTIAVEFGKSLALFGDMMAYVKQKYIAYEARELLKSQQFCPEKKKEGIPLGLLHYLGLFGICGVMQLSALVVLFVEIILATIVK